mmetsp:Transcript_40875/g.128065  ORF Transcript_40875/g.128065 Transcript_40875/m.128065 type:complete len:675 (-) Transcript_40875:1998-4022(-)
MRALRRRDDTAPLHKLLAGAPRARAPVVRRAPALRGSVRVRGARRWSWHRVPEELCGLHLGRFRRGIAAGDAPDRGRGGRGRGGVAHPVRRGCGALLDDGATGGVGTARGGDHSCRGGSRAVLRGGATQNPEAKKALLSYPLRYCWPRRCACQLLLEPSEAEPRDDVHALELLEKQLAGVGQADICDGLVRAAVLTPSWPLQEPALLAHRRGELIAAQHEALHDEVRRAVADEAIALHLAEAQAAVAAAALRGLPRENGARAPRARVHLVHYHVLELLVEHRAHEDVAADLLPRRAAREDVLAVVAEAVPHELLRGELHAVRVAKVLPEGGAVRLAAAQHAGLAGEQLDHLSHGHSARETVRVHDEVRADAVVVEGHVLLRHDDAADALLAVAAGELVADLGAAALPQIYLDEELLVLVGGDHDLVHVHARAALPGHRRGLVLRDGAALEDARVARAQRALLVDEDLPRLHLLAHVRQAVLVQREEFAVALVVLPGLVRHRRRPHGAVQRAVGVAADARLGLLEHEAAAVAAVDAALVDDDGVLDVVARVRHDGHAGVLSARHLIEVDEVQHARRHHGLLRVHHGVEQRVDALVLVHGHRAHGLLAHGALVRISRGLVVVGEGDEPRDHAHDRERVDLQVRVARRELLLLERDEAVVLLVHVHVLHDAVGEQVR